jgi:hypothetical protein
VADRTNCCTTASGTCSATASSSGGRAPSSNASKARAPSCRPRGGTLFGAFAWALTGLGGDAMAVSSSASPPVYALMLVALLDKLDQQITLLLFFFLPVTLKVRWLLIVISLFTFLGWASPNLPGRHAWPAVARRMERLDRPLGPPRRPAARLVRLALLQRTNAGPSYAQVQGTHGNRSP